MKRRSFLKMATIGAGGAMLPFHAVPSSLFSPVAARQSRFRIGNPEWILHNDGTFDLIAGAICLRQCRPVINGQSIFVHHTFMGDSPKGKRIIYELNGGSFVMIDLKINRSSVSIGAELSSMSRAPFQFSPLGDARVEGAERFYRQGFGTGGPSGLFDIQRQTEQEWGNSPGEQAWAYDSYLTTALLAGNGDTLAVSAYDHYDFIHRSTIYNKPHRIGLRDKMPDTESLFLESGFVMENIPLKDDFIKLPDIYLVHGSKPYETLQHIAWNISENIGARKHTRTSYHWLSRTNDKEGFSFDKLKKQLEVLDSIKPAVPIQSIMIDDSWCAHGDWLMPDDRWPKTMEDPAREIFKRGYRAGIWTAPFAVDERSRLFKRHPNWLIRDLNGNPLPEEIAPGVIRYVLDGSHPEVQKYIDRVFRTMQKMGFTFFKTDLMHLGLKDNLNIRRYNRDKSSVQIFVEVLRIIREAISVGSYWLVDSSPFAPLIGFADGMKVTTGIGDNRTTEGVGNMLQESFYGQYFNTVFWQNDPDSVSLQNDNKLSDKEKMTIARWNGILGGVVHTYADFASLPDNGISLWRFLQPKERPNAADPLFWDENRKCKVLVREYAPLDAWGLLFVNDGDEKIEESFSMSDLNGANRCWVWLWNHDGSESIGRLDTFRLTLDSHESRLLYVSKNNEGPPQNLTISGLQL